MGTELVWSCDYTGFVKRFLIHRFDSLAKVVVSPVFQTSVDVFQKRSRSNVVSSAGCFVSFGDSSADDLEATCIYVSRRHLFPKFDWCMLIIPFLFAGLESAVINRTRRG